MVKWKANYMAFYNYASLKNGDLPGFPNLAAIRQSAQEFADYFDCTFTMHATNIYFSCDEEALTVIKLTCPEAVEKVYDNVAI